MSSDSPPRERPYRAALLVAIFQVALGLLFTYGGIRSPDGEAMYRTSEALTERGTFAVSERLPVASFGLPQGNDGRFYSIFGPAQAVAATPVVGLGRALAGTGWYVGRETYVPRSHYVGDGLFDYLEGTTPDDVAPHARRVPAALFNVLTTAALAACFLLLLHRLTGSMAAAVWGAIALGAGTPFLAYSGTFFSEPMATAAIVLSLYFLVSPDDPVGRRDPFGRLALAGALLGLAVATHLSAILFLPFWIAYAHWPDGAPERRRPRWSYSAAVATGTAPFLLALASYNFVRFGSVFETGRTADPERVYATFVAPWEGLSGLLWSSGKGLLWYCPLAVFGLVLFGRFAGRYPRLATALGAAVAGRILFIACRSDWHGGFSLGPRYLLQIVPICLIPVAFYLRDALATDRAARLRIVLPAITVAVVQQIYFALGEIFSFFHATKFMVGAEGSYFAWRASPLFFLLSGRRGPWLLQGTALSNGALWALLSLLAIGALYVLHQRLTVPSEVSA